MQDTNTESNEDATSINDSAISGTFEADDWDSFIDEILPKTPESSKFSKIEFTGSTFNVESFIEKRKDEPLDELRHLLSQYVSRLRQTTTNIINDDYNDFVHVSSSILEVGPSIDRVIQPLIESRHTIVSFRQELLALTTDLESKLIRLKEIEETKKDLSKIRLLDKKLQELETCLISLKSESPSPRRTLRLEKLLLDLLQTERLVKSIKLSCILLRRQQERFSIICHEANKLQLK